MSALCAQPQFAYLPSRGTFEAISRATAHCRNVRNALFRFRRSHEVRSKNELVPDVFGGFMVSIDLKRAFDSLPRPDLFRDLHDLGVDQDSTAFKSCMNGMSTPSIG